MITLERLQEVLAYDLDTGVFTWLARTARHRSIGQIAGRPDKNGYIEIQIDGRRYKAHRLAWFYVHGKWPKGLLDHRDNVTNHNRIDNLREATGTQNQANSRIPRNNKSGFKGVSWNEQCRKWKATISFDNRQLHLGLFSDINDAAAAYRLAAEKHFGEFARAA